MIGLEEFFRLHLINIKRNIKPTDSLYEVKRKLAKFDDFPAEKVNFRYLIRLLNKYKIRYAKKQRIGKYIDKYPIILKMYRDKERLITISRKTKVPVQTVKNIIKREYGEYIGPQFLSEETWQEIAKEYENGKSIEHLSILYGVSMPTISSHLKGRVEIRKQGVRIYERNLKQRNQKNNTPYDD